MNDHQEGMTPTGSLPNHEPHDWRLLELYRGATPTQKLAVVARLNATLIGLKEAEIRARLPALVPAGQREMLRHWWLSASD